MASLKPLNIGIIGYGFMGRTHSNAYRKVNHFFDLQHRPVLKAVCGREEGQVRAFAEKWGYESTETDWRKLVAAADIDAARAAAAVAIAVLTGPLRHAARTGLEPHADHVLASIDDLPALLNEVGMEAALAAERPRGP